MLFPIVAAEDVSDSVYGEEIDENIVIQSQDDITDDNLLSDEESDDVIEESDDDLLEDEDSEDDEYLDDSSVDVSQDDLSADLEITSFVTPDKLKVGDYAIFTFVVTNYGPDKATNVVAYANILKGDVLYISSTCDKGVYDSYKGIWVIGDLEAGESAMLLVFGKVLSDAQIITMAYVTSDTPDPDTLNNLYMDVIDVESDNSVAAEKEKLPATGNPILMAILAVLAMAGVSLGRRD